MRFLKVYSIALLIVSNTVFSQTETSIKLYKPYKDIITAAAITQNGMFTVHRLEDRSFFELQESIFNKDILLVSRLSKGAADNHNKMVGFPGDQINNAVIRFEKGPNNKVFFRRVSFGEYAPDSNRAMFKAVFKANLQSIAAAFDIKTIHPESKAIVIDVTEYLNSDNDLLFFDPMTKSSQGLGAYQGDKSYIAAINAFAGNVEIKTVKTYLKSPVKGTNQSQSGTFTLEINTSMVCLPEKPMTGRYSDDRVGYFSTEYTDFDADPQGVKRISLINRWRLQPKAGEWNRYFSGELVEPEKPIIFYIDPTTPEKWVPYLIQGVNDWQVAFQQAGFKNAIYARRAPTRQEDSTWSLEDARYSAIVYKPSDIPNASGPTIADPRTGEILESHINWYHNVMKVLHDWYFVQAGAIDPRARTMHFSDSLMGKLIRFVSSHEVGHTLGLLHNFGSSATVPVDSLRNKRWVECYGHTPSIMDYARFNYIAQPEDQIGEAGIFPRINDYDKWAIEWGYRLFPNITGPDDEKALINRWTIDSLRHNSRLWYGPQKMFGVIDPRSQNEDLGDDAMKAGIYGINNLKRITRQLAEWTKEPNEGYLGLQNMYEVVLGQFSQYCMHVLHHIGGIYSESLTIEQNGNMAMPVPLHRQRAAIKWLNDQVFITPTWLRSPSFKNSLQIYQKALLNKKGTEIVEMLINRMPLIASGNRSFPGQPTYTLSSFLDDMKAHLWAELVSHTPIDDYRRDLQNVYVDKLISAVAPSVNNENVTKGGIAMDMNASIVRHLKQLSNSIKVATPLFRDETSTSHLNYAAARIEKLLYQIYNR